MTRRWRRLRWWWSRQRLRLALWLTDYDQLGCGCHWHPTYGVAVQAGCPRHD